MKVSYNKKRAKHNIESIVNQKG